MSQFLPLFLPTLLTVFLLKFFQWPLPYETVVDPLYGTLGLNYLLLAFDFLVIFLITAIVVGLIEVLLAVVAVKSFLKDLGQKNS